MSDTPILEQMETELATRRETLERAQREIQEAEEAIAVLEPAIKGFRNLGTGHRPSRIPASIRGAASPNGKPKKGKQLGRRRGKGDWEKGRQLWDAGKSPREIAEALGVSPSAVYLRQKSEGWPAR